MSSIILSLSARAKPSPASLHKHCTRLALNSAPVHASNGDDQQRLQVFSGIQPTGLPHLGNYFGALEQWIKLANERRAVITDKDNKDNQKEKLVHLKKPVYGVVDVHSYSSQNTVLGQPLYDRILDTVASLLALGLNDSNCILVRQSDVLEHFYLDNVLDNFVSPNRLTRMTQFKDKTKDESSRLSTHLTNNGLLTYPILQAADILVYRAQLVPVGEDQVQHLELAREIAQRFNAKTGSEYFPEPVPLFNPSQHARRVRSLRDPSKKMSKSDANQRAHVSPLEPADTIRDKFRKALTDDIGAVYYDADKRPGVSNLMRIHHLATGMSFDEIEDRYAGQDMSRYKADLAETIIEQFAAARKLYGELRADKSHLERALRDGYSRAKPIISETIAQVRYLLGSLR